MKITPKIIGTSLMFSLVDGDKTRTHPSVATLSNLRTLVSAKHAEVLTHQQAHRDAHNAIRNALKANQTTAVARAKLTDAEARIADCMTEVGALQALIDEVTSTTIEHDATALTQQLQAELDQVLAPFDPAQLTHTESTVQ